MTATPPATPAAVEKREKREGAADVPPVTTISRPRRARTLKLYLIGQEENNNWDTYDSAVVAALKEEDARNMNPLNGNPMTEEKWKNPYNSWCSGPEKVQVRLLGRAGKDVEPGVVCASFNAG